MPPAIAWSIAILLLLTSPLAAQDRDYNPNGPRKEAAAARVPDGAIRVDGRLDEEAWGRATPITDFVQKEPTEGAPPTEKMDVRFVYDDVAIYVGARMYSRDPSTIQAPMGRRDNVGDQAEQISVSLDTFHDRRTAYTFGVTASGVRLDRFHSRDDEDSFDSGFDPVWEAKTRLDEGGWTAELWIPFAQLRFSAQAEQIWGLNVRRFTPTLKEEDYWVLVPRTVRAWASRFGDLRGIGSVRPSRRVELLPYIAGSSTRNGDRKPGNPFDDGRNLASRVGADLKLGFGPNLTLDATVNPDFGQVEADPAEVNLTAFETRFSEKRPFFIEGSQLLNVSHPNVFYSRRIGARPTGPASGDYVDYPSDSTILAAAKLTGRLPSRTSLGILSAVTDEESARILSVKSPGISKVRVAPRTAWGLARIQQEFGPSTSSASAMVVGTHRDLSAGDPLAALLSRNAFAAAGDALLRFNGGEYELSASGVGSFVSGERAAIERIQRANAHYFQRPDRDYARLDPTRTSLSGFSMQANFRRTGGRHWLWGVSTKIDSPEFESTDVANLNAADGIQPSFDLRYRETRPGRILRSYSIGINSSNEWNWGGNRQNNSLRPSINLTWSNFWTTSFSVTTHGRTKDWSLTRGGPVMEKPRGWTSNANFGNSSTAQTRWSGGVTAGGNEDGGMTRRVNGNFSFRPGPRWQLSIEPSYDRVVEPQQYVTTLAGGRPETFGNRYVFAYIERSTFSTEYRLNFTLKPDVNLDVYAEPFAASGRYYDFGELLAPGGRQRMTYGRSGTSVEIGADGSRLVTAGEKTLTLTNRDFNVRSFHSNVVLRWEWRPGSTLYLVWQQNRDAREAIGTRVGLDDVFRSITAPGSNIFLVKTSFWLPVR